mmetsp:Transcript_64571/g.76455  ORF Transcript_64571/g.76455 Transcript_64571/m.76455 type:complete len:110 (-) Transcript_64571:117-446(-)
MAKTAQMWHSGANIVRRLLTQYQSRRPLITSDNMPHAKQKKEYNIVKNCISCFEDNIKPVKRIAQDSDMTVTIRQLPMPLPVTTTKLGDSLAIDNVLYKTYCMKETFRL